MLWCPLHAPARLALCSALLAAPLAARADTAPRSEVSAHPPPSPARVPAPAPARRPLSAEDAALVRELSLVENAELLRVLDLFEPPAQASATPRREPPAAR